LAAVRFQDQLGEALRHHPGVFTYHPPDGMASQYKPADWLCCRIGRFIAVEAKQCRTPRFYMSGWTPQQRNHCRQIMEAAGLYWLVINWRGAVGERSGNSLCCAVRGVQALRVEEPGLDFAAAAALPGSRVISWQPGLGWDVEPLFVP